MASWEYFNMTLQVFVYWYILYVFGDFSTAHVDDYHMLVFFCFFFQVSHFQESLFIFFIFTLSNMCVFLN